LNVKYTAGRGSEGNEKHIIGNWRKHKPCYIVYRNLTELCSPVGWKEQLLSDKLEYLAGEISEVLKMHPHLLTYFAVQSKM